MIERAAGHAVALELARERLSAPPRANGPAASDSPTRVLQEADRERSRIARDLHDRIQGPLVMLGILAARIAADPSAGTVRTEAEALRDGLAAIGDELRRVVHGVMPALLIERGLEAATEDLVDRLPLPARLELGGIDGAVSADAQSTGYFVIAEALTNAVKHSKARELTVHVGRENGRLQIKVCDDGVGGARLGSGSGLGGIADRLGVLGGRLRIDSPPGRGTRLTAEIPC
jgi:signal transduction histidine kinase